MERVLAAGSAVARKDSRSAWPDAWLISAIRGEPPDERSLDVLVTRYWNTLFARCQALTLDRDSAGDLAQDAWLRVLRSRDTLEPDGNFHAYIRTVATNLWRDRNRTERRAGAMADHRLASLNAQVFFCLTGFGDQRLPKFHSKAIPRSNAKRVSGRYSTEHLNRFRGSSS